MLSTEPPRPAAPIAGAVVSASVEEVHWKAETTAVTNGAPTNGTNRAHSNGTTTDAPGAPEAPSATADAPIAGESAADAPALVPGEIDVESEVPPKKRRWFRRNK
jgi:hypothetical protein